MAEKRDVVIIGGGHNGLVTAFYLAKAGFKPLVLERRATALLPFIAGRCGSGTDVPPPGAGADDR